MSIFSDPFTDAADNLYGDTPSKVPMSSIIGGAGMGLQILSTITGANAAYDSSKADKTAYAFQAAVERNRAQVQDWQAADALARGSNEAFQYGLKAGALRGSQVARSAAGNKALDEGSPYNITADTDYIAHLDMATIGDNAAKEAWALRMSAQTTRSNAAMLQARSDAVNPSKSRTASLLGSAGQVAAGWYRMSGGLSI